MFIWAAMAGGSNIPPEAAPKVDGLSLDSLRTGLMSWSSTLLRRNQPITKEGQPPDFRREREQC